MKGGSRSRRILLLGSNGGKGGLAICRAFGKAGHEVSILRLSSERSPAEWSRFCHRPVYIGAPAASVSEYLVRLTGLLDSQAFDYLVPIDDAAFELTYLDDARISARTRVLGPSPAAYAVARDQVATMALLDRTGLRRPAAILLKRGEPAQLPVLPCYVSARVPCAVIDDELQRFSVRRVNTVEALDAKLRDDLPRVDVVLQAPTSGRRIGLHFCAIDGEVLGATETLSLHESSRGGDSYWQIESPSPGRLAVIRDVARELSWTGFLSIECREEREGLSVTKLAWSPNDAIALSRFAGVDFYSLLREGLEGVRRANIATPSEAVYLRDFGKDVRWALAQAAKPRDASALGSWVKSFAQLVKGTERVDLESLTDPAQRLRRLEFWTCAVQRRLGWRVSWAARRWMASVQAAASIAQDSSLLIVCQGNINRSVVAEYLFRARGCSRVQSAGLLAVSGRRPSAHAERYVQERLGVDISGFRSRSVDRAVKEGGDFSLVVCFERRQAIELIRRFPKLEDKVVLLSALAGAEGIRPDVADPHGQPPRTYLSCFQRIDTMVEKAPISENSIPPQIIASGD